MKVKPQQYICDLTPYQPGMPIELVARQHGLDSAKIIKLASNENPLGMGPKAKAAIRLAIGSAHRYPDQYALIHKLAGKLHVAPECLVLGNGSNDVLDLIARTFLCTGDEAISSQYAFAVYAIATQSTGATNVIVPSKDFGHDLDVMRKAVTPKTKVIWIANPNNPTGTFVSGAELAAFLSAVPKDIVVVLDEAYGEYSSPKEQYNSIGWLAKYPSLIITRTFSKIHGLAGLRIGYGIASKGIAEIINRVRQPFNVNSLALAAAAAALDDDEFVLQSRELNDKGRRQLLTGLQDLGLKTLPAHGNFVTFHARGASKLDQQLLEKGIIVRPLAAYDMPGYLRVTIGARQENARLLNVLSGLY